MGRGRGFLRKGGILVAVEFKAIWYKFDRYTPQNGSGQEGVENRGAFERKRDGLKGADLGGWREGGAALQGSGG